MHVQCFDINNTVNQMLDGVFKIKVALEDPEVYQKVFIVAFSAIQAVNFRCGTKYFEKIVPFLDVAAALDFYGFLRVPYRLIFPYTSDWIDEEAVLNDLERVLINCDLRDASVECSLKKFAKEQLVSFLEKMRSENIAFSSGDKLKESLKKWLEGGLRKDPIKGCDSAGIDLGDLQIVLKPSEWLVNISEFALMGADLFCVPDLLQEWGVVNLESCAATIGQTPFLSRLTKISLGEVVYGFLGVGYLFQFLKAAQDLQKQDLSPREVLVTKCILICSAAEVLFSCSNLIGSSPKIINDLALIAKTTGLVAYFCAPKPVYFRTSSEPLIG